MPDALTLYSLFERGRMLGGGRRVRVFDSEGLASEVPFSEFAGGVARQARGLRAAGLRPGDRVATLARNDLEHFQMMWSAPLAGGVFHGINPRLSPDETAWIIRDAGSRFLFCDEEQARRIQPEVVNMNGLDLRTFGSERVRGFASAGELFGAAGSEPDPPPVERVVSDELSPAVLCYTSGTTGVPKGVYYTHRSLVLHSLMEAMTDGYGICSSDHVLLLVPFCHGACWGVPYSAVMCGADISLFRGSAGPARVLEVLRTRGVTFTAAIPEVVARIVSVFPEGGLSLEGLRILMGGTAPSAEMLSRLAGAGVRCRLCWGMTETLSAATMTDLPPGAEVSEIDQGVPLPLTELSLGDGAEGSRELLARGPCVTERYHGSDEEARTDGWFATGDLARLGSDGVLRLCGRKKDLIKSGGEWLSPGLLEAAIMEIPGVRECAVIGAYHSEWGERPVCVLSGEGVPTAEALREFLLARGGFAKWQLPDGVVRVPALPRTSGGKLDRRLLRERFGDYFGFRER